MGRVRTSILLSAAAVALGAGAGGCQPKAGDVPPAPTTRAAAAAGAHGDLRESRPAGNPREPMHRVEVMSRSSAQLAESIVGRTCRVQLRRDALGLASNTIVEPTGRWGAAASIEGTILEMTDQWLVVRTSGKRTVIPHASILVIELQD